MFLWVTFDVYITALACFDGYTRAATLITDRLRIALILITDSCYWNLAPLLMYQIHHANEYSTWTWKCIPIKYVFSWIKTSKCSSASQILWLAVHWDNDEWLGHGFFLYVWGSQVSPEWSTHRMVGFGHWRIRITSIIHCGMIRR